MIKIKLILLLISLTTLFTNAHFSHAQSVSNEFTKLEPRIDSIFSEFNDIHKPGAVVGVVMNNQLVFSKGYGSANLEYGLPITTKTIFNIASVAKQFTVFAVLLLESQGKLSLDDDIRKYVPEVPDFDKVITLRHLATHTSGLRNTGNLLPLAGWVLDDVITHEHIDKLISRQKELNFDPGEEFLYCNTGYTLLADVVAKVSGQSFASFTEENIFIPLKMKNSLFYDDYEKIIKNRAYSYYKDSTGYKKIVLNYEVPGSANLFTTVEDLSLWAINFSEPTIGSEDIFKQMSTLGKLNNGETSDIAYGQYVNQYRGLNQIYHTGSLAGFRTYLGRFPDQDYAVIVISNYDASSRSNLPMQVTDVFLEAYFSTDDNEEFMVPEFKTVAPNEIEKFLGHYWNDANHNTAKIYIKNDTLINFIGEGNEFILTPVANDTYQVLNVGVKVILKFEHSEGTNKMIEIVEDRPPNVLEQYVPAQYSKNDLKEFTGTYYSEELQASYNLVLEKGTLVLKHLRRSDISLDPIKTNTFLANNLVFPNQVAVIEFERDKKNSITSMRISGDRVKNIYFENMGHNAFPIKPGH